MTFTQESLNQIEAAGVGFYRTIRGVVEGRDASDIGNIFAQVGLTRECIDEIRADNDKAVSYMLGSALRAHGAS